MPNHTPFPLPDTFWAKTVERSDGCLIWTGAVNSSGYGCYWFAGTSQLAHRVAHLAAKGPTPDGWHVDHLCRVKLCVNADHLEAVTPAENNRRMIDALTTVYPGGRSYPFVTHHFTHPVDGKCISYHVDKPFMRARCSMCPDKAA